MSRPTSLPAAEKFSHGTRSRYVCGCRCDSCRNANRLAYHAREAKAKAAAAAAPVPTPALAPQVWTAPDGTKKVRHYKHACPGVDGFPCPLNAHLRKDSTGGVCARCRKRLVWNGTVSAERARLHLIYLSRKRVGRRAVSDACDVSHSMLQSIRTRRKKRIRRDTESRILAVTPEAMADHALVKAGPTMRKLEQLLDEGFTKAELARRLGSRAKAPSLQVKPGQITAKKAMKVEQFYEQIMAEG